MLKGLKIRMLNAETQKRCLSARNKPKKIEYRSVTTMPT